MQGTQLNRKEVLLRLGEKGYNYCNKQSVLAQPPISSAYSGSGHSGKTEVRKKQWGEMQKPPLPQHLASRQEHFNQEIKVQYRLGS